MTWVLLVLICCVGVYALEKVNTNDLDSGECGQQLCELQKELLTLKTLIAFQNTQIAKQNVQIERQNTRVAEQTYRILEEVIKSSQLRSHVADLEESNNQHQREIDVLKLHDEMQGNNLLSVSLKELWYYHINIAFSRRT